MDPEGYHQHKYRPVEHRPAFGDLECIEFGWCDQPYINIPKFILQYGIMGGGPLYVGGKWDFREFRAQIIQGNYVPDDII